MKGGKGQREEGRFNEEAGGGAGGALKIGRGGLWIRRTGCERGPGKGGEKEAEMQR